jgi:predicted HTH domain antitoxin
MENITIEVELPRDLLIALDIPIAQLGQRTKEWIVLELFREGKISSGKAGELLGMSRVKFIDLLDQYTIPYLDLSPEELASDVQVAMDAAKGTNGN